MWKEWLFFYLIYSQTPSRTSSLPWEISLNLSRRGDVCLVASSDCNSQGQRDFLKRTRAIPSAQRQRTGFNPAAWNVPVPSPRFLLVALSCPASSLQIVFALGS